MSDRRWRIYCRWFGCVDTQYEPACKHCGEWYYDGFIHLGDAKIWPLIQAWRLIKSIPSRAVHRCDACNGRMWFKGNEACCSAKCYDGWCPF